MATRYSNTSGVPLSLAVFLATDHYDYNTDPFTISATALMKPVRQIILAQRLEREAARTGADIVLDLVGMLKSRMGTAIHTAIELAWKQNYKAAMKALGYPDKVINRIAINPEPEDLHDDMIPVYMEQRVSRKIGKWTITGKADFIAEGCVEDFKSTSTFAATSGNKDDDYILQGSIYRWLDPKKITDDRIKIQWIFTDWSQARAKQDPKYPQANFMQHILPLKSITETEQYIRRKLELIERYWDAAEADIPQCDDSELWRSEPVYKYYKGGDITASRSTKNFDDELEARTYMATKGGNQGIVHTVPGQVMACRYCPAFSACSQKDALVASGDLTL